MRPDRWSYLSWPVPASGSRCSSGAVVGYRRSRCTRIAQPWPRAGYETGTVHEFGLERPKEALHGGIVEAIPLAAHGGLDAVEAEQFAVVTAGILGGFNRSSQHVQFDWPASTGPELRREFSIRGSCGAVY